MAALCSCNGIVVLISERAVEKSALEILLKAHEMDPKFTEMQIGIEIEHLLMTVNFH